MYSALRIELIWKGELPFECPKCYNKYHTTKSKNETKTILSLPINGMLVTLVFPRIRINCAECSYPYLPLPKSIMTNHKVTGKFAEWIYEKCKVMTYVALQKEIGLSDTCIRKIEKEILTERIKARKITKLTTLGIDEIQSGHGHQYSTIISELDQEEVIHIGNGRKERDLIPFFWKFRRLLPNVEWIVMDMWKAFIKGFKKYCKNGKIIHDHFHIAKHLNEELNEIRKEEYRKAKQEGKEIVKGKKWLLLTKKANLSNDKKSSLKILLNSNIRILKAYLLKEEFSKLWRYSSKAWAEKFWENWKKKLRWQRLKPYKKFAKLVDKHIDGIMNFYLKKDKVKMGYIEGLN